MKVVVETTRFFSLCHEYPRCDAIREHQSIFRYEWEILALEVCMFCQSSGQVH